MIPWPDSPRPCSFIVASSGYAVHGEVGHLTDASSELSPSRVVLVLVVTFHIDSAISKDLLLETVLGDSHEISFRPSQPPGGLRSVAP